jgi:S1-C subfamily serine protease
VAVLLVAWALGVAVSGSGISGITGQVRDSTVLGQVDRVLPAAADSVLGAFNDVVGSGFFPQYLDPFAPERIVEVGPGPKRLLSDPDVAAAEASVLKIRATNRCGRGVEGSGFVYADGRVMTNAHVVAGVSDPSVEIKGDTVPAEVVHYDSDLDIAVLALDTTDLPTLSFDTAAEPREGVAILGYPQDGPYDVQVGRIRAEQRLRSPDIYGDGSVIRSVFSLRGLIRPGNSGGPIVSSAGDVVGVVFAASVTDRDTGYALTAEQVGRSAVTGVAADDEVGTGDCAG